MENNEEVPEIQSKLINGVEISNLEYSKIAMVCDYLILDRFHDISSFLRLEKCFGPFFAKESPDFLPDVFKEICGEKKKYISFARLILAYTKWKSKSSTNENFNKFMNIVFCDMIKTQDEVIGKIVEGGRIFSTRNTRGRKVISRFSVLTDETKNKIEGFHIQYDDFFDSVLSPKKIRDDITLEMNFEPNGKNIRDRDGISHIGGKYSITRGIIKFLIFKCRSGKTFYIGDEKEEDGEQFELFLFGTSSCQLKSVRVELVNDQLIYFEPKFQPSLRINQKLVPFDSLDEKYINENILNTPLIFEENEMQNMSMEQLIEANTLLIPCVGDDAFIDKKTLVEPLFGKDFNEVYKTFLISQNEKLDKEKEELKRKMYEKTLMRKHLLKIYFKKFKIQENILVLKAQKPVEPRINMDKFLCKVKAYKRKVNKKREQKKEELKKTEEEDEIWDDGEDWENDPNSETNENKEESPKDPETPKEQDKKIEEQTKEIKINKENEKEKTEINVNNEHEIKTEIESPKIEDNKTEIEAQKIDEIKIEFEPKIEVEPPKIYENKIDVEPTKIEENKIGVEPPIIEENKMGFEPPKIDENKGEVESPKVGINKEKIKIENNIEEGKGNELKVEVPGEEKILLEVTNEKDKEPPQEEEKIILKAQRPKKLLKKGLNKLTNNQEEKQKDEIKIEEAKLDGFKHQEPKKEEIKIEEPKVEEKKKKETKNEKIKTDESKKEEIKNEEPKKQDKKIFEENSNKIIYEKKNGNIKEENVEKENIKEPKNLQPPKRKSWFCLSF